MNKPEKISLDSYYAEAGSWANDRHEALARSRRTAWIIAATITVIAVCQAVALIILLPLKTIVPYTLLVDRNTGFVQTLKPIDAQLVAADAALTQSFLVQYVIAREGYDYDIVQNDYRKVALWSAGAVRDNYIALMQATNPNSPIARLSRSSTIDIIVKSVTSLGRNVAMVRYERVRRGVSRQAEPAQSFVAVIAYAWSGAPMSVADRFINPLGFQVVRYRTSMEALPTADTRSQAATPATAVSGAGQP